MYRITDIITYAYSYKQIRISALYEPYKVICRDGDKVVEISFPSGITFDKDSFMAYIKESYGIEELIGVVGDFLFVFTETESKLLSYLTWNGVLDADLSLPLDDDFYDVPNSEHLLYILGTNCYTLINVLLDMRERYIIRDDLLIIGSATYLSYKILDISKFNALLTKIIVLGKV